MEDVSLEIFIPNDKQFYFTPNIVIISIFAISLLVCSLSEKYLGANSILYNFFVIIGVFDLLVGIVFLFLSGFLHKHLNGELDGEITFKKSGITIDDREFELKAINDIEFNLSDYYGYRTTTRGNFSPTLSQGVDNYVKFTTGDGEPYGIYFQLQNKDHYKDLLPFINEAKSRGKMSDSQRGNFWS